MEENTSLNQITEPHDGFLGIHVFVLDVSKRTKTFVGFVNQPNKAQNQLGFAQEELRIC